MFKAPIYKHDEGHILLTTTGRINRLAEVAKLYGHKMELVQCVQHDSARFRWTDFLRDAYLALGRLPDDDVEAHHIKNMLTKATDMFQGVIPFRELKYTFTMDIVKKLQDWEADVLSGKTDVDATLKSDDPVVNKVFKEGYNPVVTGAQLVEQTTSYFGKTDNPLRLKFRLDVSREIGLVPMQELKRVLATLPFDIELTTPIQRATLFNMPVYIASSHTETLPPEGAMDSNRFRLSLTFTTDLGDTGRELVKERMLERKVAGSMIWDDNTLVLATSCSKDDTLTDVSRWRDLVEREVEEVLASLTVEHKFDRLFR